MHSNILNQLLQIIFFHHLNYWKKVIYLKYILISQIGQYALAITKTPDLLSKLENNLDYFNIHTHKYNTKRGRD